MNNKLLEIENLTVGFETDEGNFNAVDQVSFYMDTGEVLGLVGESGCGKSVTALSIPRLIPMPPGRIKRGSIRFKGNDVLSLESKDLQRLRGSQISMIFQEPASALSPLHRIGKQMVEAIRLHDNCSKKKAWDLAEQWLKKVGISDTAERMYAYPHQISGGMRQRVMIAMALMTKPDLIIADEPTTAIDVTIQLQIFQLIKQMKQEHTSILLITHDMGVIWEMCDRVLVMYASRIVEEGTLDHIFSNPSHPYTIGLLKSIPKLGSSKEKLSAISGSVPSPFNYPKGCHFTDRCPVAFERCKKEKPLLEAFEKGHKAACFYVNQ